MTLVKQHLIVATIWYFIKTESAPGNLTDLDACKVSHLGVEFIGKIGRTEGLVRCQSWTSSVPHAIPADITDENFPEKSKKLARNYCRNPTADPLGPWCYTMKSDLLYDTCAIPLCRFTECKLTGPGMEYSGVHKKSSSTRNCLKWNKDRKEVKTGGRYASAPKYPKTRFPDDSLSQAKRFCRNPDGDPGGPWCFVEDELTGDVEKEYCDVPFCDEPDCMAFTKNSDRYALYTHFNSTSSNLTFGVKLWHADAHPNASARLVLSLLPMPLTGADIGASGAGLEILIGNNYSALRFGNKDARPDYEDTAGALKSTGFTAFSLGWHDGFLSFGYAGRIKPIFLAEYRTKNNLLGYRMNRFRYYSAQGTDVLWSFPFCKDDFGCDVHTTVGGGFERFWPLREKGAGFDLYVYVRAFRSARVLFVASPAVDYPRVKLTLGGGDNVTSVVAVDYSGAGERNLMDIRVENILDYWTWKEFSIDFFSNIMSIYVEKPLGLQSMGELTDAVFRNLRWFSVSSENSVAHWSFYCAPPPGAAPPKAYLPECALNARESHYKGTQDVTSTGLPCLPWSASSLIGEDFHGTIPAKRLLKMRNYCRDPSNEDKGTYCYAAVNNIAKKTYCNIRKCKSEQCKIAGTGNDYSGTLHVTRSNRTCISWVPKANSTPSPAKSWNSTLFPENSASKALNFCRNPSRNPSGSWCYTSDPVLREDACDVRDCDKPEECTVVVRTTHKGRKVFVLPQWKESGHHGGLRFSLKLWNPDEPDGVAFRITPIGDAGSLTLQIGADDNQRIVLLKDGRVVERKTMPHLIGSGRWTDMWLQMRTGEIRLGFEGVPTSLFEWTAPDARREFDPAFLSYSSMAGRGIALWFKCDECHTENSTSFDFGHVYPVGFWSDERPLFDNLTLLLRGTGYIVIKLMTLIEHSSFYNLVIDTDDDQLLFLRIDNYNDKFLLQTDTAKNLLATDAWSTFVISFNETRFVVKKNNQTIMHYENSDPRDRPLAVYWFSIAPQAGWVVWSANCEALDLDGAPRDGGWSAWSPWTCSTPCGGGDGYRTRTCSNPRPNVFGRLCTGAATSTGTCNQFPCGDVNPETLELARDDLQRRNLSYVVKEGSEVWLRNDQRLLDLIARDSPKAYYEWTLNGVFIKPEPDRVLFRSDDVHIKSALPRDSGLYACMLFRINKQRSVIRIASLAVISSGYDYDTRATRPLKLPCHSIVLGYVYSDLSLKIYANDKLVADRGTAALAAVDTHAVESLREEDSGEWKCVVEQKDLRLRWVTNYARVNVKKAPNALTHLMEDELTRPIFGRMGGEAAVAAALVLIVALVAVSVAGFLVLYKKHCTLNAKKLSNNRR
ncbi:unnamed protein product [Phyllotreta striolata]|uniref:Uncharacterized protein n=1 Tax=Phyllotreta striolata TaxID=444603 RepID=A0A9N9TVA6_PHYSR|nr:unnamed protein product [Phyllotreta striolata]